jgi:hypothetical protein
VVPSDSFTCCDDNCAIYARGELRGEGRFEQNQLKCSLEIPAQLMISVGC